MATPLTEAEWLDATDAELILSHLRETSGLPARKLRLWGCACVRRMWDRLTNERSRLAVAVAESFADGMASTQELAAVYLSASAASIISEGSDPIEEDDDDGIEEDDDDGLAYCSFTTTSSIVYDSIARAAAETASTDTNDIAIFLQGIRIEDAEEAKAQATLLRHIVGNPWRPLISSAHWPTTVIKLADALYSGEDCSMALHDALLECGQDTFAEHFRE
jgi:hypothetical protein